MKIISKYTLLLLSPLAFISCEKPATEAETAPESSTTVAATAKPYTLDYCLVSGEKLGSMGEPVSHVYEGQEVKFCCSHCQPTFEKDPEKYLKELETAAN